MASVVQALVVNGANPATSITATFGSNVTAGSRIVVGTFIAAAVAHTSSMTTDSLSNTYALDAEFAGPAGDMCYFSAPSPSGGACTVTYNPATNARLGLVIMEVSGIDGYGGSQFSTNSGTGTALATGAITPAAANGICYAIYNQANPVTFEADYATGAVHDVTGRIGGGYKLISSTSSEEATGTFGGSVNWQAMLIRYPDTAGSSRPVKMAGAWGGFAGESGGFAG